MADQAPEWKSSRSKADIMDRSRVNEAYETHGG